ncbi:MAG: carboxypeptidase-like regulatory domain-containing protein, partial [Verrucomicrobiota bacterium]
GATGSRLSDRATTDHEGRAEVQIDLAEVRRDLAYRFEIVGYSESEGVGSTGIKMITTLDQLELDQSYNIALSRGKDQPIRVTDSSGNPVKGLRVEFDPLISSNFIQSIPKGLPDGVWNSKTDESGRAVIKNVPENASMLFSHEDERFGSWKDSYVPWSKQNHEVGEEIELQALEANELSGRVTLSNGKALPRVLVGAILVKGRSGNPTWSVFSSWTDENGDFRIGKLPRGEFSVRAQIWDPELIENWTDPFLTGLHLAEGSKKEGLELVATKGGTLKIAVTGSRTGHPVQGVTFELNDLNGISVLHQPKTGWRLFNKPFDTKLLPEGEFSLKISHPLPSGYVFSGKNEEKTVAIKTGETTEVAFELLELAPVEVRVVNKAGEPVEGAQVVYFDPSKETGHQIAKSGSDGMCYFSVEKIEDTYLIAFDGQAGSYEPVPAKSGEEVELRLLEESLAGVRGTLVDEEGNPVSGAKIIYGSMGVPGDRKETFTDAEGGFQVSGIVPRDKVELFLEKDGFALGFVKVDLEANQVEQLGEISLKAGSHSITGQIYDASGDPVNEPYIRIGRSGSERVLSEGFADNNGVFTFTTLPNEKLWVEAGISTVEGHSIKISEAIPSKEKLRIVLDPVEQTKPN